MYLSKNKILFIKSPEIVIKYIFYFQYLITIFPTNQKKLTSA